MGDDEELSFEDREMTGIEILKLMFPVYLRERVEYVCNKDGIPKKEFLEFLKTIYFAFEKSSDVTRFINRTLKLSYWI